MGQGGGYALALSTLLAVLSLGAGDTAAETHPTCGETVLYDWSDGSIDAVYPVACYREALASLPEDVRVYSSAEDDIQRALRAQIRAGARRMSVHRGSRPTASRPPAQAAEPVAVPPSEERALRAPPVPLLVIAATAAVAAGSMALGARRFRIRRR